MSLLSPCPIDDLSRRRRHRFAVTLPGSAQSRAAVTVADYERAEKFLNYNTNPLVTNGAVRANWMPGDRFWYRNQTATGSEFILVDAAKAHQGAGLRSRRGRDGADRRRWASP